VNYYLLFGMPAAAFYGVWVRKNLIFTASIANALLFLSTTNSIFEPVKDHPREKGIP
jgi:hypothetical protein